MWEEGLEEARIDALSEFWQLYTKNDKSGHVWDNDWEMPREVGVDLTQKKGCQAKYQCV